MQDATAAGTRHTSATGRFADSTPLASLFQPGVAVSFVGEESGGADDSAPARVRLPGGPRPDPALLARLADGLPDGGILAWVLAGREARGAAVDRLVEGLAGLFDPVLTYDIEGSAFIARDAPWARPLHRSGKLDLLRDLHRRLPSFLRPGASRTVTIAVRGPGPGTWWHRLLARIEGEEDLAPGRIGLLHRMSTGTVVAQLGRDSPVWALKAGWTAPADRLLPRHVRNAAAVRELPLPDEILQTLPEIRASGCFHGVPWVLEPWMAGAPGHGLMYRRRPREALVDAGVEWILGLHGATLSAGSLDAAAHARRARGLLGRLTARFAAPAALADRVEETLRRGLPGLPSVQGHGDFGIGNLLYDPESLRITGVLDWDLAEPDAPPLEDLFQLLAARKGLLRAYDHSRFLAALWRGRLPAADRRRLGAYLDRIGLDERSVRPLSILFWTRYLEAWEELAEQRWYRRTFQRTAAMLD